MDRSIGPVNLFASGVRQSKITKGLVWADLGGKGLSTVKAYFQFLFVPGDQAFAFLICCYR